jgi:hypothetical protein
MTGVGMCGVFMPDRFRQAGRGTSRKVSDRLGVGVFILYRVLTGH